MMPGTPEPFTRSLADSIPNVPSTEPEQGRGRAKWKRRRGRGQRQDQTFSTLAEQVEQKDAGELTACDSCL
jgi:hypothetical protein